MNRQKRRKPEEIIALLRKQEISHLSVDQFCQKEEISVSSLARWRKQYGQMTESDAKRLRELEKENTELKKMYADAMLGIKVLKSTIEKKALSTTHRRELAKEAASDFGCSQRKICKYFGLHRSTYRYEVKRPSRARILAEEAVVEQSLKHPEFGSDKIGRLVRKQDHKISNQRVREVRREECLQVPSRPKKKHVKERAQESIRPRQ